MPEAALPPDDEEVAEPFFLRRIMRGADLVLGTEAGDGSASFVMVVMFCGGGRAESGARARAGKVK